MCQLTYTQLPGFTPGQFKLCQGLILKFNASAGHKDGFGYMINNRLYKKGEDANTVDNIFKDMVVSKNTANRWSILHVRKASFKVKNKIGDEFCHPFNYTFEGYSPLVGAHNGTLEHSVATLLEDEIDSQMFFQNLYDNIVETNRPLKDCFETVINDFYGKFAFLIRYDNVTNIIRGRTADLYFTDVTINTLPAGFIVNTEKNSLLNFLSIFREVLLVSGVELGWSAPEILPINSIHSVFSTEGTTFESSVLKLESNFREVTNKPYTKPADVKTTYNNPRQELPQLPATVDKNSPVNDSSPIDININKGVYKILEDVIKSMGLSIFDITVLFDMFWNKDLICATTRELDIFTREQLVGLTKFSSSNKKKTFDRLLKESNISPRRAYIQAGVPFPFMLSGPKKMARMFNEYNKSSQKLQ